MKGDRDWPPVPNTDSAAWEALCDRLRQSEQELESAVRALPPSALGEGKKSAFYMLHGVVQHSTYHAGQIMLLRKAFEARHS